MKVFSQLKSLFLNVFLYKCVLLIFLIPTILSPAASFNYQLLFVMLGWGAVLCLYDLLTKRKFLRAPGAIWLIVFLVFFCISVVLNFRRNFSGNIALFGYTVIALLLLYPDNTHADKKMVVRELYTLNNIFITMTAILSTISFCMFVCKYSDITTFDGRKFIVGWYKSRLYGLYKNMCYMTSAIGIALIVIQFTIIRVRGGCRMWYRAFLIFTFVINFFSMCMENAKGAFISLAVFAATFAFFGVMRYLRMKNWQRVKSAITSTAAMLLAAVLVIGAIYGLRPVLAYVPSIYEAATAEPSDDVVQTKPDKDVIVQENVDRDVPENYGALTGRPKIWKFGIEEFRKQPLFGYGPNSHMHYKVLETGLSHFHNIVIQSLVSVGLLGSIWIAIFLIKRILILLASVWKRIAEDNVYMPVCVGLLSLLFMFLINSMSEVTILYQARFTMFLFWMMLGYLTTLLDFEKRKEDTAAEKAADYLDKKLTKANINEK